MLYFALYKRGSLSHFSALQEAQDIFGLEFDLSEFDEDGGLDDDDDDEDDDDLTAEEITAKKKAKSAKKKFTKKSIYQVHFIYNFLLCYLLELAS